MTAQTTNLTNAAETTLSSGLAVGATTLNVDSTTSFPAVPFYAVIDPDVDASREIVLVDSATTATSMTLSGAAKRGQDGTTDVAHDAGAKVVIVPVAAHFGDMNDRIDAVSITASAAYASGGTDVPVADGGTGASTAAAARNNLGLAIGTDVQAYSAVLAATTASFTTADETKLDGIEASADVTDAANVAAAGAVMESDTTVAAMSFVVDEDDMASDSATKVPTQQSVKAYVDAEVGSAGGSDRAVIGGFSRRISDLVTNTQLGRAVETDDAGKAEFETMPVLVDRAGSIVGLTIVHNAARTAGSVVYEVYKNGVATGFTVTIDGSNTQYHYATQASGTDTFVAGDRLDVRGTASSFAGATYMEASITVEYG